ncbi:nucleotidyltransferase domain-containing protein [Candidatus Micrarchaeota archaeon]|nr:nucleotidyltransferase domain-containing protein [Candidatus Micrarchaeota archaeon]
MIFHNVLDTLFSGPVKAKILFFVVSNKSPYSEREIARRLKVSHTAVNKAMKDFHELNLVTPMKVGGATVWNLNEESYSYKAAQNPVLLSQSPPLEELKQLILTAVCGDDVPVASIFGSIAVGNEKYDSDIDLLVVVDSARVKDRVTGALNKTQDKIYSRFGNSISPIIYTINEVNSAKVQKVLGWARKGVILKWSKLER